MEEFRRAVKERGRREWGREERWIRRQVVEEQSWRVDGVEVREGS